ncbi:putative FRE ferric reductase-like transmembrane component [Hortaea werneckii]|nr:putative FRE ferric reductase-like transmembrane component [Hortaea werneckii]
MAPREAYPIPKPMPGGEVTGFGHLLNYSNQAYNFTFGLDGVNQAQNYLFVNIILASFLGLLAATFIYRWVYITNNHLRHLMTMGRWVDQRYWMYNRSTFWPSIKRNLLYAPLGRVRHNREIQLSQAISIGTLPSRFHTILLGAYLICNLVYLLVLDWSVKNHHSAIAELRGRSGILAAINLIPTVLFALRNNPLIPILKVSYDTFNLLHRWCARVMVLQSVIHTIAWAVNAMESGGMHQVHTSLSTSTSYMWGMVATVVFGFVLLTSFSPIRHAFYETFLNVHRVLVWVGIVGVYVHLDKANLPQLPYVKLVMAFWVAEWIWRCFRICYHNVSRRKGITKVTVEALPAEACRVTFELKRPWRWTPGCHVHAYLPAYSLWSSHPFSIAWAESKPKAQPLEIEMEKIASKNGSLSHSADIDHRPSMVTADSTYSRKSMLGAPTVTTISEVAHKKDGVNIAIPRDSAITSVSLIMRARTGMTRKLYEKASASKTGTLTTWGAIEGPYGGHDSMTSYGTVILFAGGVGITHCIGFVHHLMLQYQAGTSSTQKILLVWSVPNTEALEWVRVWMDQILRMDGRRDVLRIQLFITKPRHRGEVISNTGSVQMFPGRCNPETILKREMAERIGALGVTVCGPGPFADGVRSAARSVVTEGVVDFIEEAFTY